MFRRHHFVYTLGVASLALAACGEHPAADPRTEAPLVRTSAVHGAAGASRSFSGVVGARVQSDLGFRVQGKVIERLVDAGQTVKRGQPLMRIDPIDLGLQARAQQKLVDAAQARATQTAADEARYRDLVAAGAVSASTYDQLKAAAESAKAQLVAAQAQAVLANNASGYAVGMADALEIAVQNLSANRAKLEALRSRFWYGLQRLCGLVVLNGPAGRLTPELVGFFQSLKEANAPLLGTVVDH